MNSVMESRGRWGGTWVDAGKEIEGHFPDFSLVLITQGGARRGAVPEGGLVQTGALNPVAGFLIESRRESRLAE